MWTWSTGLGIAAASGHESAAIRRAWVSGDPAGLSQRRSGGHWVRGGPVAWSPTNGAPGRAATRELGNPPAGLGEPPPAADISRDRRAWGLATKGLAALAAIPPNSHADLQWAKAGWRAATSLPREQNKRLLKTKNKTGWMGAAYGLGLVFCHGAHTREDTGTRRRGLKLK